MAGKLKGNQRLKFPGIKPVSHGDATCSMGSIVNNVASAGCHRDHLCWHINVGYLQCAPEANIILYVSSLLNENLLLKMSVPNSAKLRKLLVHVGPLIKRERNTASLHYSLSLAVNRGEKSAANILLISKILSKWNPLQCIP